MNNLGERVPADPGQEFLSHPLRLSRASRLYESAWALDDAAEISPVQELVTCCFFCRTVICGAWCSG